MVVCIGDHLHNLNCKVNEFKTLISDMWTLNGICILDVEVVLLKCRMQINTEEQILRNSKRY